jgi:hypothetical protein
VKLEFKVAGDAPLASRKRAEAELAGNVGREPDLAQEVGVPDARVEIDVTRKAVTMYYHRAGAQDEILAGLKRDVRGLVRRFEAYFRPAAAKGGADV